MEKCKSDCRSCQSICASKCPVCGTKGTLVPQETVKSLIKDSKYLKEKYGEKVYKLPVNLPVTCPNRKEGGGCLFCADAGTGFEAKESTVPVLEQLQSSREKVEKRYHAHKFIVYFQNYTNI